MTFALTILAIGSRSHRIACNSWRLYRRTVLRLLFFGAGIFGDIEAWNTDRAGRSSDFHRLVQNNGGLICTGVAFRLETDAVDEGIDLGDFQNLRDTLAERRVTG